MAHEASSERATVSETRRRLESAADGLLFLSETDAPFEYVELPDRPSGEVTPEAVATAVGAAGAPVEARSVDDFLSGHIERADPADPVGQANVPRFQALKETLTETLSDVRVFRVGEVNVRYYVLGRTVDGAVAGLVTQALET